VLAISAFVLAVLVLVVGGFGVVTLATGAPSRMLGAIFTALGVVLLILVFVVVRKMRRRRTRPLYECRPVAVLDRKLGLFSYGGGAIVPLTEVRFARSFQVGSSSPKLVARTPGGTKTLKRGNPFDGGVGNVDEILTAVVKGG
jgi:hypothetical protein